MSWRKQSTVALWLVAVLPLFSFPLGWWPQTMAQSRFSVSLPWAAVVFVALLLAAPPRLLESTPPRSVGRRAIVGPVALLLVSWLVSVRFSARPHISVGLLPGLLSNFAVFLIATRFPREWTRQLLWWWLTAAAVVAGNAMLRLGWETEVVSTIGNRNFLGAYLAASIVIGVALWERRAALVCVLLTVGLCFCHSRGAWLALGGIGLLWFLAAGRPRFAARVGVVVLIAGSLGLLLRGYLVAHWRSEVRPVIWQSTAHMIADRPLIGHGLGTFVVEYPRFRLPEYFRRRSATNVTDHAHNELLEIAAEQGLLGLAATLWLWGVAVASGFRAGHTDRVRWGLLGAFLVLLLHGMLDVGLRYPPDQTLFWLLLGLLWAGREQADDDLKIPVRSRFSRLALAGACLIVAGVVALTAVVRPVLADVWERRARLAEARGDFVTAAASAIRALDFSAFRLSTRYLLAGVLAQSTEPAGRQLAIDECQRLEELAPDYADVTFNLGQLYVTAGEPARALPYLRRAVAINPFDTARRVALADALRLAGERAP